MDRPSQGTIYYIVGQSGGKTYRDLTKRAYDTYFYNPLEQPNYLVVEVKDKTIRINVMLQDGTLLDSFFIDKAKDVSSDMPIEFQNPEYNRQTAAAEVP
jgi:hypothetical protein